MAESPAESKATARERQKALVASFPLWLHVRAHSILWWTLVGAIVQVVNVLAGWRSLPEALGFFALWAITGLVIYWCSFAWYLLRRRGES